MATLNSITASPPTVPYGGSSTVVVDVTTDPGDPGRAVHLTAELEGQTADADLIFGFRAAEVVTFTTDPDAAGPGVCVVRASEGLLTPLASGQFTLTVPSG